MCGALPSRIARRNTGRASPSISRNMTPGASVRTGVPVLRAMRWTTRYENSLSSSTPAITSITSVTAEARKATRSAHQKPSTLMRSSVIASAASSIKASSTRIARKPKTSVSGSLIAAMTGERIALSAAITAATRSAAQKPLMWAPGTIQAAIKSPIAEMSHVRTMCSGRNRRRSSRHSVSDAGPTRGSAVVGGTSSVGGVLIEWRLCAPGRLDASPSIDLRGETEIVAADYPFPDLVWTAVVVVSLAVLVWLVVMALGDAWRRRDIDRATKAGWTLLVVLVPLAGVSAYLIANGEGMARRKAESKRTR